MPEPSLFMQWALDAAAAVRGTTSPNPWVGAALVRDGQVIGVGATQRPGGLHAEAVALAAAADARGATFYVTLEPCAPFPGKRTAPCAGALIQAGVERVVIALEDPDPSVRGRGSALLREAGVVVDVGDGAEAAALLLRPYLKHRETGRPYVFARFAASVDGRTATVTGDSKWITGELARERVHRERAWVDAIMVGSGTVLADDPALTARPGGVLAPRQPVRVVLDARGRISPGALLFKQPGAAIVATSSRAPGSWRAGIAAAGAELIDCEAVGAGLDLDHLLGALAERGIMSVWAEGGATVLGSLLAARHADEVWAFIAPVVIGGDGLPAVNGIGVRAIRNAIHLFDPAVELLPPDLLFRGYTGFWSPRMG